MLTFFLSTTDPDVEIKILQRLKSAKVSHESVKGLLRQRQNPANGKRGLQTGLKFKNNGKEYSYALYHPETTDTPLPMVIVLHGMGGNGDTTVSKWAKRLNNEFIVVCPSYRMGAWWARPAEDMVFGINGSHPIHIQRRYQSNLSRRIIQWCHRHLYYWNVLSGSVCRTDTDCRKYHSAFYELPYQFKEHSYLYESREPMILFFQ